MKAIPSLAGFPEFSREAADPLKILFIRVQVTSCTVVKPPLFKVTVLQRFLKQLTPLRTSDTHFMGPSVTFAECLVGFSG